MKAHPTFSFSTFEVANMRKNIQSTMFFSSIIIVDYAKSGFYRQKNWKKQEQKRNPPQNGSKKDENFGFSENFPNLR
jgi:hypothetical protein